jgi:hypothetical protein
MHLIVKHLDDTEGPGWWVSVDGLHTGVFAKRDSALAFCFITITTPQASFQPKIMLEILNPPVREAL